jgi:hypothetical protein
LGLSPERFTTWTLKYGADSLGRNANGEFLLPEFPAFSMIAWIDVDPVAMNAGEMGALITDCDKLSQTSKSPQVLSECAQRHLP